MIVVRMRRNASGSRYVCWKYPIMNIPRVYKGKHSNNSYSTRRLATWNRRLANLIKGTIPLPSVALAFRCS